MNITLSKGRMRGRPLKIVIYGPEGIGKSTFASMFPDPLFIDTEGSTSHMDVLRVDPAPSSFTHLLEIVRGLKDKTSAFKTLVLDTADWAEKLCIESVCAERSMKSIEDAGYGKGYVYIMEEFGKLLNELNDLLEKGVNIVVTAHAMMRKFEQPDELGSYDRWELKMGKKTAPMLKEWADMLLFANYKTIVVNVDNQGAAKGKNKAQGGRRVMYTSHHPCWDAKNRFGLPEELPFEYAQIAHLITVKDDKSDGKSEVMSSETEEIPAPVMDHAAEKPAAAYDPGEDVPFPALALLMQGSEVTGAEIRAAVMQAGYYPEDTPIAAYDEEFVKGELIPNWNIVMNMIENNRIPTPF